MRLEKRLQSSTTRTIPGNAFVLGSFEKATEVPFLEVLCVICAQSLVLDWIWVWRQAMALTERSEVFVLPRYAFLPFPCLLAVANPLVAEGDPCR